MKQIPELSHPKFLRSALAAMFALGFALLPTGVGQAADFAKKDPLTIGYSIQSAQDPYWQGYMRGIKEQMQKYGFKELLTQDSQASAQKQTSGSIALVNNGISALVISPHEPSALAATIAAAHREKIPVIVGDVGASGEYDGFVLSDNYAGGVMAAEFIQNALKGKDGVQEVAIVSLNPTTSVNVPRTKGFTDTISKNPAIKIVSDISGKQTLEGGFAAAQAILAANPKIAAIYCLNDSMAAGASQAIDQAGGEKNQLTNPVLVGFNGDPIALELLGKGKLAADVAQDPHQQGVAAVDMAWAYLNGETPKFSDAATKTLNVPVKLVTPDTLEEFKKNLK